MDTDVNNPPGNRPTVDNRTVDNRTVDNRPGAATIDWNHEPCGPSESPFAEYPFAASVLHISREVIHHGAEPCILRDLYRAGQS